jgi:hypothetical protein
MERRTAIEFCVKLKKTATETSEMLKNAYVDECLSRTDVFEWHKRFQEAKKMRIAKIVGGNNVDYIFYAKIIIYHEFVPEKQTVNGKLYKDMIRC